MEEQNKLTFGYLEECDYRGKIHDRLKEVYNYPKYSCPFKRGDRFYFFKNDGLQNQSVLYTQETLDAEPTVPLGLLLLLPPSLHATRCRWSSLEGVSSNVMSCRVVCVSCACRVRVVCVSCVACRVSCARRSSWTPTR